VTGIDESVELGDVLVTAFLLDDDEAARSALMHIREPLVRDCLVYLAQQVASLWEQGCDDPLGEWRECLLLRAENVYRFGEGI
jgi:hypothetical protein